MWCKEGPPTPSHSPGAVPGPVLFVGAWGSSRWGSMVPGVCVCRDLTENPLTTLPTGSFLGFTHLQDL